MNNPLFLTPASISFAPETAQPVPIVVQTVSSGQVKLIICLLVIITFTLLLLPFMFYLSEKRCKSLKKSLGAISRHLEHIEESIAKFPEFALLPDNLKTPDTKPVLKDIEKNVIENVSETPEEVIPDKTVAAGSHPSNNSAPKKQSIEKAIAPVVCVSGLKVNSSSHYNLNAMAVLDEIPVEEALFHLYSDMTVKPKKLSYKHYTKAAYYTENDFTLLYSFLNKDHEELRLKVPVKCLQLAKPARVIKSGNSFQLLEKGIIIVEEQQV